MSDDELPAWSQPFHDGLGAASSLRWPGNIDRAWAYGDATARGVRVAVLDSGIEAAHPMVGGVAQAVDVVRDAETGDVTFVEGDHEDLYGHGTACAAIIRSLAPGVELTSVRVLGATLKGSALVFAHGLDWCIERGIEVVNLSLSTSNDDYFETFHDLIDQALYRGMIVVSAMSNEHKVSIPSEFAGVFSVACAPGLDREQVWCNPDGPASWGAAGIDVEIAWQGGSTIVATGNSFAAPVVAGHLARIVGAHPGISPWEARSVLAAIADNAPGATT